MDMNKVRDEFADILTSAASKIKSLDKETIKSKARGIEESLLSATISAASEALKRLEERKDNLNKEDKDLEDSIETKDLDAFLEKQNEHEIKMKEIEEDLKKDIRIEIKSGGKAYITIDSKWKRFFSGIEWN